MPPVDAHIKRSIERTGRDYRELHEWLDDPEMKTERHDIMRIHEFETIVEERYGKEGLEEYMGHIHDDIKSKFEAVTQEFERKLRETLNYFGIKTGVQNG
ncbi:MAG: hypothetical protein OHK0032_03020 [Thermodesulfovibrionales bacterium]